MTDQRLETIIGNLLRYGVVLAGAVVLAGGVWYLAANGSAPVSYRHFSVQPRTVHSLEILPHPQAVILLGLLLLIATPVARVAFSLLGFALERDGVYVALTSLVLAVLLYSIGTAWW
ncbi:MAG TPA: DUF1634 domain-containing protein [Bryobacteraceae bacterium]|nr:DUF1634 domain-containing protein [Bryobacteraceae bacterium]